jgi:hypothetical protein
MRKHSKKNAYKSRKGITRKRGGVTFSKPTSPIDLKVGFSNSNTVFPTNNSENAIKARLSQPKFKSKFRAPSVNPELAAVYAGILQNSGNNYTLNNAINAIEDLDKSFSNMRILKHKALYNFQPDELTSKEKRFLLPYIYRLKEGNVFDIYTPNNVEEDLGYDADLTPVEKDNIYRTYLWIWHKYHA